MNRFATLLIAFLLVGVVHAEQQPSRVLLLGSFHMDNPGRDMINVPVADVLAPEPQAQIESIVARLARFDPTLVAVELSADDAAAAYALYLNGGLRDARSETVQIGFRLARELGHAVVHGIDVPGEFPMQAVVAYAQSVGRMGEIQVGMARVMARAERLGQLSGSDLLEAFRRVNERSTLVEDHALYMGLLRFGAGEEQPGVALMAAWTERNLGMCARLVQRLEPGARGLLLVGSGHVEPIRECLKVMPGIEVEDAIDYL